MNNKVLQQLGIIVIGIFIIFLFYFNRGIKVSEELLGGITRVAIGTQTKWLTDLIPSSSFSVNLGSSASRIAKGWFTDLDTTTGTIGTLTVSSTATGPLIVNGNIRASVGTAASPSYTFRTDQDTGMYMPASNSLAFSTLGTERMRILSDGNVGIGESTPTAKLEISGSTGLTASISNTFFVDAANQRIGIGTTSPASTLQIATGQVLLPNGSMAIPSIAFSNQSNTGFSLDPGSGGILFSAGAAAQWLSFPNGGFRMVSNVVLGWTPNTSNPSGFANDTAFARNAAGVVEINDGTAGNIRDLRVRALNPTTGSVGIGTTAPTSLLTVQGRGEFQGTASASYLLTGNTLQVGGFASAAYSRFGTVATTHGLSANNDVLINGKLEVDGAVFFDGTTNFGGIASASLFYAQPGTAASPSFSFAIDQDTGMFRRAINALGFSTLGSERMTILSGGNVGIGTTSPTGKLDIVGDIGTNTNALFRVASTSDLFRVQENGNVGIGTSTPNAAFNIAMPDTYTGSLINISSASATLIPFRIAKNGVVMINNSTTTVARLYVVGNTNGENVFIARTLATTADVFRANNSAASGIFEASSINDNGRITLHPSAGTTTVLIHSNGSSYFNGGNVGVGVTTPGGLLEVDGNLTGSTGSLFKVSSGSTAIFDVLENGNVGIGTTGPLVKLEVKDTANADLVFTVEDSSGRCNAIPTTTGLTWSCSSDQSLKKDILPATKLTLPYVVGLPLFEYTVKKTGERVLGPVAQETIKNYPELVKEMIVKQASGSMPAETILAVSQIPQPILIKAIQELDAKIKSLEEKVKALEKAVGTPPLGGLPIPSKPEKNWLMKLLEFVLGLFSKEANAATTSIKINNKILTEAQYTTLKTSVVSKFETKTLNFNDGEDWKAIVNNEIKKCGGWVIKDVRGDLFEKLNGKLKLNKC